MSSARGRRRADRRTRVRSRSRGGATLRGTGCPGRCPAICASPCPDVKHTVPCSPRTSRAIADVTSISIVYCAISMLSAILDVLHGRRTRLHRHRAARPPPGTIRGSTMRKLTSRVRLAVAREQRCGLDTSDGVVREEGSDPHAPVEPVEDAQRRVRQRRRALGRQIPRDADRATRARTGRTPPPRSRDALREGAARTHRQRLDSTATRAIASATDDEADEERHIAEIDQPAGERPQPLGDRERTEEPAGGKRLRAGVREPQQQDGEDAADRRDRLARVSDDAATPTARQRRAQQREPDEPGDDRTGVRAPVELEEQHEQRRSAQRGRASSRAPRGTCPRRATNRRTGIDSSSSSEPVRISSENVRDARIGAVSSTRKPAIGTSGWNTACPRSATWLQPSTPSVAFSTAPSRYGSGDAQSTFSSLRSDRERHCQLGLSDETQEPLLEVGRLRRTLLGDDTSSDDHDDAVADLGRLGEQVRGRQHGGVVAQRSDHPTRVDDLLRVEADRGLVQDVGARGAEQRLRETDALALALRQPSDRTRGQVGHAGSRHHVVDIACALQPRHERQVRPHRQRVVRGERLGQIADGPRHGRRSFVRAAASTAGCASSSSSPHRSGRGTRRPHPARREATRPRWRHVRRTAW